MINEYSLEKHFESTLKVYSDSINYIEGLENYVKIEDQGQACSSSFSLSRSLTSTSTPKDVQMNTDSQTKQKSTIKPNKQLTSDLFGNQQKITDEIDISDSEDRDARIGNLLPSSVNQRIRGKYQIPTQYNPTRNNTYISSMNDNREHKKLFWEQQMYNYQDHEDNERNSNKNNIQNTNIQSNRQQENRTRRSNSITTEERKTTVTEPP